MGRQMLPILIGFFALSDVSSVLCETQSRHSAVDAQRFVAVAETDLEKASESALQAEWTFDTNITDDTKRQYTRSQSELGDLASAYAKEAARYDSAPVDPVTARKLAVIKRGVTLPASGRPGASQELAAVSTELASKFSRSSFNRGGIQHDYDSLNDLMGSSRNPDELTAIWQGWRTNFLSLGSDYSRLVELANTGAKELGFSDVGALWRSGYDMPENEFSELVARLWTGVEPLFKNLHCYVRARLNETYKDVVQPRTGPIRADLLGHLSAYKWFRIQDILVPRGGAPSLDITKLLAARNHDVEKIVRTGEEFFTSLGFEKLPDPFWERSVFVKPRDREITCGGKAYSIDGKNDLRIKACFKPDAYSFQTAHHELGHIFYYRAYNEQTHLFRDGANDGFHEAIGDFISLYASSPTYLNQIGLLPNAPESGGDGSELLLSALEHVAVLPFSVIMDKWRWRVFAGEVSPQNYNTEWWSLVRQYQGLVPPAARPSNAFDPAAHRHIPTSVPYTRYFLAEIYQFQFYRAACRLLGHKGPLHRCSIFGRKEVGERLNTMLRLGSSKPWPDALEAFTHEREADAGALIEYFAPLDRWLTQQNKGESCGW